MKICFITWILESTSQNKKVNEYIPVGPMLLATILRKRNNEVSIYNVGKRINELPFDIFEKKIYDEIVSELLDNKADLYAFSTIIEGFQFQLYIADRLKESNNGITVLFGGPQASVYAMEILRDFKFVDYILRGESENNICDFIDFLEGKIFSSDVSGLSYRNEGNIIDNQDAPIVSDLDELPALSYDLFDFNNFDYFPIEVGRGCPFSCTFCATSGYFKQKFRMKSLDRILNELKFLVEKCYIKKFNLLHDLFTFRKSVILEFCQRLEENELDIKWTCSVRADTIDKEMLDKMYSVGCVGIYCGIETGSERMQKEINKNLDIKKSIEIIKYSEEIGIKCMLSFVYGFPQEHYEDIIDTLKLINQFIKHNVQVAHPKILKPVKGSPIYNQFSISEFNRNVYNQRNIILLKEFNYYSNNDSIVGYIENMITKYSEVFSYYYVYKPEILTVNTLLALGIIISSDNFNVSVKLLLEVPEFDFVQMLKSFDKLDLNDSIRKYEDNYINYLQKESQSNIIVDKICEIAKYEKDKLEFKRLIDSNNDSDNLIVKSLKYKIEVNKINSLLDYSKLKDLTFEDNYYMFCFSKMNMSFNVYAINNKLYNFSKEFLDNKDGNVIRSILNNEISKEIPLLYILSNSL